MIFSNLIRSLDAKQLDSRKILMEAQPDASSKAARYPNCTDDDFNAILEVLEPILTAIENEDNDEDFNRADIDGIDGEAIDAKEEENDDDIDDIIFDPNKNYNSEWLHRSKSYSQPSQASNENEISLLETPKDQKNAGSPKSTIKSMKSCRSMLSRARGQVREQQVEIQLLKKNIKTQTKEIAQLRNKKVTADKLLKSVCKDIPQHQRVSLIRKLVRRCQDEVCEEGVTLMANLGDDYAAMMSKAQKKADASKSINVESDMREAILIKMAGISDAKLNLMNANLRGSKRLISAHRVKESMRLWFRWNPGYDLQLNTFQSLTVTEEHCTLKDFPDATLQYLILLSTSAAVCDSFKYHAAYYKDDQLVRDVKIALLHSRDAAVGKGIKGHRQFTADNLGFGGWGNHYAQSPHTRIPFAFKVGSDGTMSGKHLAMKLDKMLDDFARKKHQIEFYDEFSRYHAVTVKFTPIVCFNSDR